MMYDLETHRLEIQAKLDRAKTQPERNRLGQFATPSRLAHTILQKAKEFIPAHTPIRFLDPALGTGVFYSALLHNFDTQQILLAKGYEKDLQFGLEAQALWQDYPLNIVVDDFTIQPIPQKETERYNLIICNPPYTRHHHLQTTQKQYLQIQSKQVTSLRPNGLASLYTYFLLLCHGWLQNGGVAGWLIPGDFMDVKYGTTLKQYLTTKVKLLEIHRFDPQDVQFDDALVTSALVWFKKEKPLSFHTLTLKSGGTVEQPVHHHDITLNEFKPTLKWSQLFEKCLRPDTKNSTYRVRDLFDVKRGVATGANKFFILNKIQVQKLRLPTQFLKPILPSPRYLLTNEILADNEGYPLLNKALFLLDCRLPEEQVKQEHPTLWEYLQTGLKQGIQEGYLCRHRSIWYVQDKREPAPLLCTYMGRKDNGLSANPFRFIINHSDAVAPNVYLNLYPKPLLAEKFVQMPQLKVDMWKALQQIPVEALIAEGRVYGGGLYKLEPKELENLSLETFIRKESEIMSLLSQSILMV